ncbi:hypothetical protein DVR12_18520 [Chitinophaga silvatica]|uniref:Anti-sigma factor n=1 Tax=Chitinophaga silvatica TaxID=2282649 RepID=A0A3E1Y6L7_9BACT|nr:hypothetical protein [Chitinophaga silvatica]RFS20557.1 hypothetical protein DVR12_18520 [Chitinophaga silvatica]
MPEDLERFIQQHRSEFEMPGPSPRIWDALEKELTAKQEGAKIVPLLRRNWFRAAVILLLVVNAGALFYLTSRKQTRTASFAPEVQEANMYYSSKINEKLKIINAYPVEELGLDSAARKELELRNDTYKTLERELQNNPGNERIKAALIRYYQLKLDLLDRILEELQSKKVTPDQTKKHYEAEI